LSPSSLAASVLRSLPARSTKFRVETCNGEEALGAWMCPRADGHKQGQGLGKNLHWRYTSLFPGELAWLTKVDGRKNA